MIAVFMRNAVATRALAQELRTFSAAMERMQAPPPRPPSHPVDADRSP